MPEDPPNNSLWGKRCTSTLSTHSCLAKEMNHCATIGEWWFQKDISKAAVHRGKNLKSVYKMLTIHRFEAPIKAQEKGDLCL